MTCFARLIDRMGLHAEHQGKFGHLYLLLTVADQYESASPTADTYPSNPYREVLHRLDAAGLGGLPAVKEWAAEFGTRAEN